MFHKASAHVADGAVNGFARYVSNREAVFLALDRSVVNLLLNAVASHRPASMARVHGDFSPHNLLIDAGRIAVIDYAGVQEFDEETPWFDVATMLCKFEEYWGARRRNYLRYFRSPLRNLKQAFLDAYGEGCDQADFHLSCAIRHFSKLYAAYAANRTVGGAWQHHLAELRSALELTAAARR
jgi:aminoglycoside phosphotransferase (APT) family kinase protein